MRQDLQKTFAVGFFVFISVCGFVGCTSYQRPRQTEYYPVRIDPDSKAESEINEAALPEIPESKSAKPAEIPEQGPAFYTHPVRWPGETISHIAQWYTGSQMNWKTIVKANSGFDPKKMDIGNEILIPEHLLKTTEPMPKEFLRPAKPKQAVLPLTRDKPKTEAAGLEGTKTPEAAVLDDMELFELQDVEASKVQADDLELFDPVE